MIARVAKFGPVIQIGEKEDSEEGFPKYFNMSSDQLIRHISINEALDIINQKKKIIHFQYLSMIKEVLNLKMGGMVFMLGLRIKTIKSIKKNTPNQKKLQKRTQSILLIHQ